MSVDLDRIDWKRVAEPQPDGYDTEVTLSFAGAAGYTRSSASGHPTFFDGAIAVRDDGTYFGDRCAPAPAGHPNLQRAEGLIRCWPAAYRQCQLLVDTLCPFLDLDVPEDAQIGSQCGPGTRGFGSIASTVNSPLGLAEALVHEMAHHKMHALGIHLLAAERLITNPPGTTYRSPIRYDIERPMPAVVQAEYSYTYIAGLDLAVIASPLMSDDYKKMVCTAGLAYYLPKLEFGLNVIRRNAQTDDYGRAFLAGFTSWIERTLQSGFAALSEHSVRPVPFSHPLDSVGSTAGVGAETASGSPAETILRAVPGSGRRYRRNPEAQQYELWDELVLFHPGRETAISLNKSARAIWSMCDGQTDLAELCLKLAEEIDIHDAALVTELFNDLQEPVTQLADLGLLLDASDPAP